MEVCDDTNYLGARRAAAGVAQWRRLDLQRTASATDNNVVNDSGPTSEQAARNDGDWAASSVPLWLWIAAGVVVFSMISLTIQGVSGAGDAASDSDVAATSSTFIEDVRSDEYFPDADYVLEAIGQQICIEIEREGVTNLSASSFSPGQQSALLAAAQTHYC